MNRNYVVWLSSERGPNAEEAQRWETAELAPVGAGTRRPLVAIT